MPLTRSLRAKSCLWTSKLAAASMIPLSLCHANLYIQSHVAGWPSRLSCKGPLLSVLFSLLVTRLVVPTGSCTSRRSSISSSSSYFHQKVVKVTMIFQFLTCPPPFPQPMRQVSQNIAASIPRLPLLPEALKLTRFAA